ncbi:MAG: 16S rRNA (uracil(1498)-N(3))-methyltransferase [Deltaproteobacteria bacterium]|nr:16S rRNA (uracil(1498)-N(3))-methyltransferase [Deltaproteobacteria bacterium]
MRRFFVDEIRVKDRFCSITGPEAKHISRVLRMGPGDRFILMDGRGARYQVLIDAVGAREVRVLLEKPLPPPPPSPVTITLCQALLKSRPMDYIVQKTSELGVDVIIPFSSTRTVARLQGDRLGKRLRHWREIAHNAAKQCGRETPAHIEPPLPFQELAARWKGERGLKIILWEGERKKDLKELLTASPTPGKVIAFIGPEGGFGHEEIEEAQKAGFAPVSLGNRVLRSETAAITLTALIQYEHGDLGLNHSW